MQTSLSRLKVTTLAVLAVSTLCAFAATPGSGPTSTVVYVGGNDLVLKASDGKLLNFTVPAAYHFSAAGKEVSLADLRPGTTLTKAVSTGTDPKIVSAVSVVKGKLYASKPPDGITLTTSEGAKDFIVPSGTKFTVDGKSLSISELKPDMMIEATVVTTVADAASPESASTVPPMTGTLLIANTSGSTDTELPLAGTALPAFGIAGLALLVLGIGLFSFQRPSNQH